MSGDSIHHTFQFGNNVNLSGATIVTGNQATTTNSSINTSNYGFTRGMSSSANYFSNTSEFVINDGEFNNIGGNSSKTTNTVDKSDAFLSHRSNSDKDGNQHESNDTNDRDDDNNKSGRTSSSGNSFFHRATGLSVIGGAFSNIGGNFTKTMNNFKLYR